MAHHRKLVGLALALNTGIVVVEAAAGFQAGSLSLVMDAVHNLSDELALIFLFLSYVVSSGPSRNMLRTANLLNSAGLIAMSALLLWYAGSRILDPQPVLGWVPAIVGLAAAAANWGVARCLLAPSRDNPAVRLAWLHNRGDVVVSLVPVVAGVLVSVSGQPLFDPLAAALVGSWILVSTLREIAGSHDELLWPEKLVCCHGHGR